MFKKKKSHSSTKTNKNNVVETNFCKTKTLKSLHIMIISLLFFLQIVEWVLLPNYSYSHPSAILGKTFVDFVRFQYNLSSPKVSRNQIIISRKLTHQLSHELSHNERFRILGNNPEMLGFDDEYPAGHSRKILAFDLKNFERISCKTFYKKTYPTKLCDLTFSPLSKIAELDT